MKEFLRNSDRIFIENKKPLPNMYDIFGSLMPLAFSYKGNNYDCLLYCSRVQTICCVIRVSLALIARAP